jgi:tetratricopeptide (TPR) repeat protein
MAQPNVFLSHSTKDVAFAQQLETDLRAAGARVYRVSADAGGDFQGRINDALSICEWVVLVLTKDALGSPWVSQEVNAANRLKHDNRIKNILPIQAGPVDAKAIPPLWGVYNIFDATKDYPSAKNALLRELGLPIPAASASVSPESADDLLARAKALKDQRRYAEAIPLLERASRLDPRRIAVWDELGFMYFSVRRYQDSVAACDRALALDDKDVLGWGQKGAAFASLGRYGEALDACNRALALDPNRKVTWSNKGLALKGLKRYDEALDACDYSLAIDPNYALAWRNKATVLRELGRTAEADDAERKAKALEG